MPKFEDIDWDEYYGCDGKASPPVIAAGDMPPEDQPKVDAAVNEAIDHLAALDAAFDELEAELEEQEQANNDAEEDKPADDDDEDDPVIYDYTDCGGEGDRFRIEKGADGTLHFWHNDRGFVIIKDEQVSDLLGALIEWQDGQPEWR